jgi:NitT/TauT family transport system permease protein
MNARGRIEGDCARVAARRGGRRAGARRTQRGGLPMNTAPAMPAQPTAARPKRRGLAPLEPVSPRTQWLLGVAFFALFIGVWAFFTFGGYVSPTFLASPATMAREGWLLFTEFNFIHDIAMTVSRVFGGFVLAAAVAVPLGIAMGAHKGIEAFLEPFVSFCRYLPASAFIPLLILWAGIGELQKVLVIFIGSVFQILLMVAVSVGSARKDLVEAAYTLGANPSGIVRRVLIPGAAPEIAEVLRLVLGWAWTYVIVAELIGSSSGIGHMITDSQALLNTGQIIFGIIVIGLIGLVSDFAFKALNRRLFAWSSL